MRFSFILEINSERFFLADVDKPVVKIPTSIFPESGSVADCLRASRCNLKILDLILHFSFFGYKKHTTKTLVYTTTPFNTLKKKIHSWEQFFPL